MKKSGVITLSLLLVLSLIFCSFQFLQVKNYKSNEAVFQDYIKKLQEEQQQTKASIDELKKSNSDLKTQFEQSQESIKTLQTENEKVSKENSSLKKEIQSLNKQLEAKVSSNSSSSNSNNSNVPSKTTSPSNTTGEKIAYLTFDDGPSANTASVLDTLKANNIKATFFVNGHTGSTAESMYKRIVNEGHILGNHTYSHDYSKVYASVDGFQTDFDKLNDYLEKVVGQKPTLMRYPGGSNNTVSHKYGGKDVMSKIIPQMKTEGYTFFDWNVDSTDATGNNVPKDKLVSTVLSESKNMKKVIVLMHDSAAKKTSAEALPEIIDGLKKQGFKFETLSKDSFNVQFVK